MTTATIGRTPTPALLQAVMGTRLAPERKTPTRPLQSALVMRDSGPLVVWCFVTTRDGETQAVAEGTIRVSVSEMVDESRIVAAAPQIFAEVFPILTDFCRDAGDELVSLAITHARIRAALIGLPGLGDRLLLTSGSDLGLSDFAWTAATERALARAHAVEDERRQALAAAGLLVPPGCPMSVTVRRVVATDASIRKGRALAGIAWVDGRGRHATGTAQTSSTNAAEVAAFTLAVRSHIGRATHLHIKSDSKAAIAAATATLAAGCPAQVGRDRALHRELVALSAAAKYMTITFEWVKGHAGHPLNEAADRLAVLSRRSTDAQLPTELHERMCMRVVDDLREQVRAG